MKRRDFLKTGAASVALAGVPLMPSVAVRSMPVINWPTFCDPEVSRYNMATPWIRNGMKIASDCRILIRQITDEPDSEEDRRPGDKPKPGTGEQLPLIFAQGRPIPDGYEWNPWPELNPRFAFGPCPECDATGRVGPMVRCLRDRERPCDEYCGICGGTALMPRDECPMCTFAKYSPDGLWRWTPCLQDIGSKALTIKIDRQLRALNIPLEFAIPDKFRCGMVLFRGPTIDGVVMSICNHTTCDNKQPLCAGCQ